MFKNQNQTKQSKLQKEQVGLNQVKHQRQRKQKREEDRLRIRKGDKRRK